RFALEALRRDETRARNWVLLGNLQGLQGRHGEAAEAFRRAIALRPDDAEAQRGLRVALQLLENDERRR
ncbi:MAG: tetratricopeptide repeat protein, partial [Proteobacteria bacterium]|nr:tetratricopeptide repeat protein [Pseudomonadota bacterium]